LKDAALAVFARQGYLNTKIVDITAEAGRAAGSFYNHFTSKEDLLKVLLADLLAESDAAVHTAADHSADFTDRAAVRWHVAAYWNFYTRHLVEMTALRQAALVNPEFGAQIEAIMVEDAAHLRGHLSAITEADRTLPAEPDVVLAMFTGLLDGFTQRWQSSAQRVSDDEAIDALTEFLYRGLNGSA
jgi:AcrR family transcriptional regulator